MTDASKAIAEQMQQAGVVPQQLVPQGGVAKTYVDTQDALLQGNINGVAALAASANQTASQAAIAAGAANGAAGQAYQRANDAFTEAHSAFGISEQALTQAQKNAAPSFNRVNDIEATDVRTKINIAQGAGIAVTTDTATKTLTITATGTSTPGAHASAHIPGGADPIQTATTARYGLTQLEDTLTSTSTTLAATADAVRRAKAEAQQYVDDKTWQKHKLTTDNGLSVNFTGGNLNNVKSFANLAGDLMTGAPDSGFWYIDVRPYFTENYVIQTARGFYTDSLKQRKFLNDQGGWGPWSDDVFDAISYIPRGNGSPEGVVTRPVGSLYLRKDGGLNATLYVKQSGTGNTGWVAK